MAAQGLSANEVTGALISMMARSIASNPRPDTLTQDRSPPARRNLLATHGRTIHSGHLRRFWHVRVTSARGGPSALNARKPPGCPQRLARCVAMWCDAQRRVVERCDAPRRAALPTVMSISPTRPIDQPNMAGCEATSRQRSCRSRHLFRIASHRKSHDCWIAAPQSLIY
jgi:hypothetical protein